MHKVDENMLPMLEILPMAVTVWDWEFNMIYCNEEIKRILGLPDKQKYLDDYLTYLPVYQTDGSHSLPKLRTLINDIKDKGRMEFEWAHVNSKGKILLFDNVGISGEFLGQPAIFSYGTPKSEVVILKEKMAKVQKVHDRLHETLDAIPLSICFWDTDFNVLYCNQELVRKLKISNKKEYLDNPLKYAPEYYMDGLLTTDKIAMLAREIIEKGRIEFEWMNIDAAGHCYPSIHTGVSGEYMGVQGAWLYGKDTSEMMTFKQRVQLIFDAAPLVIDFWSEDGICINCNDFAAEFFGFSSKSEYTTGVYDLRPEYQPNGRKTDEVWMEHVQKTFEDGYDVCQFVTHKDGQQFFFEIFSFYMHVVDEIVMVSYSCDITEKTQKEIALANSEAKSKFLSRMSHELRTPISAVLGIAEIELNNPGRFENTDESFAKIHESASMLLNLANDILDLSKVEADKLELSQSPYETIHLINNIINVYPLHKGDSSVEFLLTVDENLPVALRGDYPRIKQILNNLLANAFKYIEFGSVHLTINYSSGDYGESGLCISVKDTGPGMTTNQINRLFEDYTRLHEEEQPLTTGTGLGMAIVSSLVQLMCGTVKVDSSVGEGTCITVHIPQTIENATVIGSDRAAKLQNFESGVNGNKAAAIPSAMFEGKVLVVDDMPSNLYVARGLLTPYGLQVDTCADGHKALEKIKEGSTYDIIFMDQMMPGINGTDTMHKLREIGYTKPIVVLTGNALQGQAEEFMAKGFDGFVAKPINTECLYAVLIKFVAVS